MACPGRRRASPRPHTKLVGVVHHQLQQELQLEQRRADLSHNPSHAAAAAAAGEPRPRVRTRERSHSTCTRIPREGAGELEARELAASDDMNDSDRSSMSRGASLSSASAPKTVLTGFVSRNKRASASSSPQTPSSSDGAYEFSNNRASRGVSPTASRKSDESSLSRAVKSKIYHLLEELATYGDSTRFALNILNSSYAELTSMGMPWCRFCGARFVEKNKWADSPCGRRTLCDKHAGALDFVEGAADFTAPFREAQNSDVEMLTQRLHRLAESGGTAVLASYECGQCERSFAVEADLRMHQKVFNHGSSGGGGGARLPRGRTTTSEERRAPGSGNKHVPTEVVSDPMSPRKSAERTMSTPPSSSSSSGADGRSAIHKIVEYLQKAGMTDTLTLLASSYHTLVRSKKPWCRYCGARFSSTWHNSTWGVDTLCDHHGRVASSAVKRALQRHPWTPDVPLYPDENTEVALLTEFLFPANLEQKGVPSQNDKPRYGPLKQVADKRKSPLPNPEAASSDSDSEAAAPPASTSASAPTRQPHSGKKRRSPGGGGTNGTSSSNSPKKQRVGGGPVSGGTSSSSVSPKSALRAAKVHRRSSAPFAQKPNYFCVVKQCGMEFVDKGEYSAHLKYAHANLFQQHQQQQDVQFVASSILSGPTHGPRKHTPERELHDKALYREAFAHRELKSIAPVVARHGSQPQYFCVVKKCGMEFVDKGEYLEHLVGVHGDLSQRSALGGPGKRVAGPRSPLNSTSYSEEELSPKTPKWEVPIFGEPIEASPVRRRSSNAKSSRKRRNSDMSQHARDVPSIRMPASALSAAAGGSGLSAAAGASGRSAARERALAAVAAARKRRRSATPNAAADVRRGAREDTPPMIVRLPSPGRDPLSTSRRTPRRASVVSRRSSLGSESSAYLNIPSSIYESFASSIVSGFNMARRASQNPDRSRSRHWMHTARSQSSSSLPSSTSASPRSLAPSSASARATTSTHHLPAELDVASLPRLATPMYNVVARTLVDAYNQSTGVSGGPPTFRSVDACRRRSGGGAAASSVDVFNRRTGGAAASSVTFRSVSAERPFVTELCANRKVGRVVRQPVAAAGAAAAAVSAKRRKASRVGRQPTAGGKLGKRRKPSERGRPPPSPQYFCVVKKCGMDFVEKEDYLEHLTDAHGDLSRPPGDGGDGDVCRDVRSTSVDRPGNALSQNKLQRGVSSSPPPRSEPRAPLVFTGTLSSDDTHNDREEELSPTTSITVVKAEGTPEQPRKRVFVLRGNVEDSLEGDTSSESTDERSEPSRRNSTELGSGEQHQASQASSRSLSRCGGTSPSASSSFRESMRLSKSPERVSSPLVLVGKPVDGEVSIKTENGSSDNVRAPADSGSSQPFEAARSLSPIEGMVKTEKSDHSDQSADASRFNFQRSPPNDEPRSTWLRPRSRSRSLTPPPPGCVTTSSSNDQQQNNDEALTNVHSHTRKRSSESTTDDRTGVGVGSTDRSKQSKQLKSVPSSATSASVSPRGGGNSTPSAATSASSHSDGGNPVSSASAAKKLDACGRDGRSSPKIRNVTVDQFELPSTKTKSRSGSPNSPNAS